MESKAYNQMLWHRTQRKRAAWENKYAYLWRVTLNKQYKNLAERINSTNIGSDSVLSVIDNELTEKTMISLYQSVGADFAKTEFNALKAESQDLMFKDEYVDKWAEWMRSYVVAKVGKRIVSITGETKRQAINLIKDVIQMSNDSGWGAEETAREIRKSLLTVGQEINRWRSKMIARTEVVTASNIGAQVGARETGFPMLKYWIPTYDSRTRDTHLGMDSQNPKEMDEAFLVGGIWPAECPGDPDLPPEESINCRCSIAHRVKF